ncbi:MAG: glucose-1-phosphate cytidylyltransferase [Nostoc sp.]
MKAVILAGGLGTRIAEETSLKPKPMIEIGEYPILWHIMKIYSSYNINDFIICCGYKGYCIKDYFINYFLRTSDVTLDMRNNEVEVHHKYAEPWKVTLVDTGLNTMTGGRLKRIKKYVQDSTFCFTYGDGVGDVQIDKLLNHHKESNRKATVTVVKPPGRFGAISLCQQENKVTSFKEKSDSDNIFVNGGFFVLEPEVINFIKDDFTVWEQEPIEELASLGEVNAYKHTGFWRPMDTVQDKTYLENLWKSGKAPWKVW